jgi:hypothetical protein
VIPEAAITHWRNIAPWPQDAQVEQDLILCRALIEIFQDPVLSRSSLLRGGTKLRAPYQRRKGRDLFDLRVALEMQEIDSERLVLAFRRYMDAEGSHVSQTEFRKNLAEKVAVPSFGEDLRPLLAPGIHYDVTRRPPSSLIDSCRCCDPLIMLRGAPSLVGRDSIGEPGRSHPVPTWDQVGIKSGPCRLGSHRLPSAPVSTGARAWGRRS